LKDLASTRSLRWTDNTTTVLTKWSAPWGPFQTNATEAGRCAVMRTCRSDGQAKAWSDLPCSALARSVCQLPATSRRSSKALKVTTGDVQGAVSDSTLYGSLGGSAAGSIAIGLLTWLINACGERLCDKVTGSKRARHDGKRQRKAKGGCGAADSDSDEADDSEVRSEMERGSERAEAAIDLHWTGNTVTA
jgi:hypothetical protein